MRFGLHPVRSRHHHETRFATLQLPENGCRSGNTALKTPVIENRSEIQEYRGKILQADGDTLFLDEIGEPPCAKTI